MPKRAALSLAAFVQTFFGGSCGHADPVPSPIGPVKNTGHAAGGAYFKDFRVALPKQENGMPEDLWVSDYDFSTNFSQVYWTPKNVTFDKEGMHLTALRQWKGKSPFTSGEVQVDGFYGYGRYEVVMRTARGSGLDTAFFLHTYEGLDNDPHDEIDFEFPGAHPRKLHLNYWNDGKPFGSIWINLPYDPAAEIHLYAFEWRPDSIRWFIDDKMVAEKIRPPELQIPYTTQRPIMNLLVGGKDMLDFTGPPTFANGVSALYACTSHVPLGGAGRQCSDLADRAGAPVPSRFTQRQLTFRP